MEKFTMPTIAAAITAIALPLSSSTVEWKHNYAEKKGLRLRTGSMHLPREGMPVKFKDPSGKVTQLQVKPWQTIKEVKRLLAEATAPTGFELLIDQDKLVSEVQRQRLFFQGQVLKNSQTIGDYNLHDNAVIYRLAQEKQAKPNTLTEPTVQVVLGDSQCPSQLRSVIEDCKQGLAQGLAPVLAPSGLGGTYFLRNANDSIVGVFKPEDEEAYAPNNPRGLSGRMGTRGVRSGLLSGEANLREVAAYLLDHEQFANVPATVRVEVSHPTFGTTRKIGSLQEFKPHDDEAGDVSSSLFTVEAAHRIAIMDIRLLNRDRNDENLLVRRRGQGYKDMELIPIDHGCALPDSFEVDWHDWAWLSWPQNKKPLSTTEKAYIARLDAEQDCSLLTNELSIRWQCLLVLRIATLFLQKGAAADLSLYDIASMMSRDETSSPSVLEVTFAQAKTLSESRRRGGKTKKRSPTVSPVTEPQAAPRGMRRSASAVSLDFDAFKLPGVIPGNSSMPSPVDDCDGWSLTDSSDEEIFDDGFWNNIGSLMDTAVSRRQMKRSAVETLKNLLSQAD
jgi:hypothetical protein